MNVIYDLLLPFGWNAKTNSACRRCLWRWWGLVAVKEWTDGSKVSPNVIFRSTKKSLLRQLKSSGTRVTIWKFRIGIKLIKLVMWKMFTSLEHDDFTHPSKSCNEKWKPNVRPRQMEWQSKANDLRSKFQPSCFFCESWLILNDAATLLMIHVFRFLLRWWDLLCIFVKGLFEKDIVWDAPWNIPESFCIHIG